MLNNTTVTIYYVRKKLFDGRLFTEHPESNLGPQCRVQENLKTPWNDYMRNAEFYLEYVLLDFVASRFELMTISIHHPRNALSYTIYHIYRLLHASVTRCNPHGVVITQVTCEHMFCFFL